jgi:hypothetical protein
MPPILLDAELATLKDPRKIPFAGFGDWGAVFDAIVGAVSQGFVPSLEAMSTACTLFVRRLGRLVSILGTTMLPLSKRVVEPVKLTTV